MNYMSRKIQSAASYAQSLGYIQMHYKKMTYNWARPGARFYYYVFYNTFDL